MGLFDHDEPQPWELKARVKAEKLRRDAREDPVALADALGIATHPWQKRILRSESKRVLLNCSRQAGKSTIAGLKALHRALFEPDSLVLCISPTLRQSQILFRKASEPYKKLGRMVPAESETALTLTLENGSRIVSLPENPDNIRGFTANLVIVDEAAFVSTALYFALRPMLGVTKGDLMMLSTPYGKRGVFFEEWVDGGPQWDRYEVPATMCPHIDPEFLATEQLQSDAYFAQEYMCQFVDLADAVFTYELIQNAIDPELEPLIL